MKIGIIERNYFKNSFLEAAQKVGLKDPLIINSLELISTRFLETSRGYKQWTEPSPQNYNLGIDFLSQCYVWESGTEADFCALVCSVPFPILEKIKMPTSCIEAGKKILDKIQDNTILFNYMVLCNEALNYEYRKEDKKEQQKAAFAFVQKHAQKLNIWQFEEILEKWEYVFRYEVRAVLKTRINELFLAYCEKAKEAAKQPQKDRSYMGGSNYTGYMYAGGAKGTFQKEIIVEHLRVEGFKARLRYKDGYRTVKVTILEAPKKYEVNKTVLAEYEALCKSYYNADFDRYRYEKLKEKIEEIQDGHGSPDSICSQYTYNYSNSQVDYFDRGDSFNIIWDECKYIEPKKEKSPAPVKQAATKAAPEQKSDAPQFQTFEQINAVSGEKFVFEIREKCFVLSGDTYNHRENIKQFFGNPIWNRALKGWLIRLEHLETAKDLFR